MYSKVKVAGHPLHPMIVGLPVTLYAVALVCFAAHALGASAFWFRAAVYANVAGVITAFAAAVPGFIDWALGIPSTSPAKATGLSHMAFNVGALIAFLLNALLQWSHRLDANPPVGLSVALPLIGVLLTGAAGFLGWKLVQTHHVGVDLTPAQEQLEPRSVTRIETHGPETHAGHGHPVS
jgi:uncharacterized membrane protein